MLAASSLLLLVSSFSLSVASPLGVSTIPIQPKQLCTYYLHQTKNAACLTSSTLSVVHLGVEMAYNATISPPDAGIIAQYSVKTDNVLGSPLVVTPKKNALDKYDAKFVFGSGMPIDVNWEGKWVNDKRLGKGGFKC